MHLFLTSSADEVAASIANHLNPANFRKLLFVTTAAEGEEGDPFWMNNDRKALAAAGFKPTDFTFTDKTQAQVQKAVDAADVIFVAGGNTFYLLDQVRKSGADKVLTEAVLKADKPYIGSSAGSIIAGKSIEHVKGFDDESKTPDLKSYDALNFVDLYIHPHWGSTAFPNNKEDMLKFFADLFDSDAKNILLRDNQYLHAKDDWYRIESA